MTLNIISQAQRDFLTASAAFNALACLKDTSSSGWHLYNFQRNLWFHWNKNHSYCGIILTLAHEGGWPMITKGLHLLFFRLEVITLLLLPLTFTLFHFLCVVTKQISFPSSLIQDETSTELQSVRNLGRWINVWKRQRQNCLSAKTLPMIKRCCHLIEINYCLKITNQRLSKMISRISSLLKMTIHLWIKSIFILYVKLNETIKEFLHFGHISFCLHGLLLSLLKLI